MPNENMDKKKFDIKKFLPIIIPVLVAAIVVSTFAVAGHIAKNNDSSNPSINITQVEKTDDLQNAKVNIVAVGDNMIHNTVIASGEQEDGSYNYDDIYANIGKYIKNADMAIINQESTLGGSDWEYTGYPIFNAPWELGEAAINAGFDVFTCANNHAMDLGATGIDKETEFFAKHPEITHTGTYTNEEEYNAITYREVNGIKFALLNYSYGTNGIAIPEDKPYLVKMLTEENIRKDIPIAKENADVVIVLPHWGTANSHDVNDQQRKYCQIFAELGVDIVIGTHPHVLQSVEWYTNEETGKKMLVYYSLGNFVSHHINLNQMCGGMAEITVERSNGEIKISSAKLAPVVDYYTKNGSKYKFSVYRINDYNNEIAATQAQEGATFEYFTDLSKSVVSEEFLDLN